MGSVWFTLFQSTEPGWTLSSTRRITSPSRRSLKRLFTKGSMPSELIHRQKARASRVPSEENMCSSSLLFSCSESGSRPGCVLKRFATNAMLSFGLPATMSRGLRNLRQSSLSAFCSTISARFSWLASLSASLLHLLGAS
eukprot:Mycagemm_TRINITY_DN9686_c0_g1::TRINITY_DN9686_c0_g1_i1::g.2617::m.2617 type:complete len:140 gc:universal TRINITY_DN9686_c0_g1_i1:1082-663(-)